MFLDLCSLTLKITIHLGEHGPLLRHYDHCETGHTSLNTLDNTPFLLQIIYYSHLKTMLLKLDYSGFE